MLATPGGADPAATAEALAASSLAAANAPARPSVPAASNAPADTVEPPAPPTESLTVQGPDPAGSSSTTGALGPIISANGLTPITEELGESGSPSAKETTPVPAVASASAPAETPAIPPAENAVAAVPASEGAGPNGPAADTPTPLPSGDPLLGPNPDLMPIPTASASVPGSPEAASAEKDASAGASSAETEQAPRTSAASASPAADPLLGPNPDLMPIPSGGDPAGASKADPEKPLVDPNVKGLSATADSDPPLVAAPELSAKSADPAGNDPAEAADESIPIVGKARDENGEEFGLPQLPDGAMNENKTSDSSPQASGQATGAGEALDPEPSESELPPLPENAAGAPSASNNDPAQPPSTAQAPSTIDPAVRQVSTSPAEVKTSPMSRNVKEASRAAAGIGEEVITLNDLYMAVKEFRKKHPSPQPPSKDELNMMGKGILMMLIERSLLTQEAKRVLKNPKMLDTLMSYAEKAWNEEELPPLLRKYFAANVYELKEKMAADHRSLDAIHESYRQDFLAQAFLQQKIGNKLKVELPEMLKYYQEHVNDRENHRPASITWREILIENNRYASPQEAHMKAQRLVERLRRGENFAKLAQAESDGPNLTKSAGGLMETSPGSYTVASVNQTLNTLPIGQVSGILEGPSSLHIVVVEKRRAAGPVTFEEIQDQIRKAIHEEKVQKERIALINKLRKETIVWTIFDNTASDPNR